ncbi:MAG: potassium transporter TrkG [Planctomycetia bacterium]|nr:potassium transporter TrkG [Planctomycetia bacterium]
MDFRLISRYLGAVSIIIGLSMIFSLPWAFEFAGGSWEAESSGFYGLLLSMLICFIVGLLLRFFGRTSTDLPLRKEAMAVVGLSWIIATLLACLPYLFSGTERAPGSPMSIADAIFETESGLSTTGASVFDELEDPFVVPRTILFWRSTTMFLGGLGFMLLFVALLGHGSSAKTIVKFERSPLSGANPEIRIRQIATALFRIYIGLNVVFVILLKMQGISLFDSLCHSFSTIATGGFSTFNLSVGHFAAETDLNAGLIEYSFVLFMILGGTNLTLLYWCICGQPKFLLQDIEWRTYLTIIFAATALIFLFGLFYDELKPFSKDDLQKTAMVSADPGASPLPKSGPLPNSEITVKKALSQKADSIPKSEDASKSGSAPKAQAGQKSESSQNVSLETSFRVALFQVVSLMTTTGFCTAHFETWSGQMLFIIMIITVIGGCSGSTSGGTKVVRWLIGAKGIHGELERSFRPSVVRSPSLGGNVLDKDLIFSVITFLFFFLCMVLITAFLILVVEPDTYWIESGRGIETKTIDVFSISLAAYSTIGPGLGVVGSQENYGALTEFTKFILSLSMLLGRLELYIILVLFTPSFWRQR